MQTEVSYDDAAQRHPEVVNEVMARMNAGSSQAVGDPPDSFEWRYFFVVSVRGKTFEEVLESAVAHAEEEPPAQEDLSPIAERLADLKARTLVQLQVKRGSTVWSSSTELDDIPPEVEAWLLSKATLDYEQELKVAQMSPEERERRAQEALEQLRGTPGFMELEVDVSR